MNLPRFADKVRVNHLAEMKRAGRKIAALTAYDYPTAQILDHAGIDLILVGDSVAGAVLGHSTTLPVTVDEMLHHARAVRRGVERALTVADMPFLSWQTGMEEAVRNAGRFLKEAGMEAVKIEGGRPALDTIRQLIGFGIPVLGHLGYTPQSTHQFGSSVVQGKTAGQAEALVEDALALDHAGVAALVLECVPDEVARVITERVKTPTIGIGSGPYCDGQILVLHDVLGLSAWRPRFAKAYADLTATIRDAAEAYAREVQEGSFPAREHGFPMPEKEREKFEAHVLDPENY